MARPRKLPEILLCAVLALCVDGTLVRGQETRAIITGTVTDPQGASVPAARLDIRNLETNVVTRTQTNGSGIYTAPPINPGHYSVTVTADGFKVAVENNLELRSSDRKAVDFTLQLGTASTKFASRPTAVVLRIPFCTPVGTAGGCRERSRIAITSNSLSPRQRMSSSNDSRGVENPWVLSVRHPMNSQDGDLAILRGLAGISWPVSMNGSPGIEINATEPSRIPCSCQSTSVLP